MKIRPAETGDLVQILSIYETARAFMRNNGNPDQWGSVHPPREMVENDIATGHCFVGTDENNLPRLVFYYADGPDPAYLYIENGAWPDDLPYGVIHRIATDGTVHGGVTEAVCFCQRFSDVLRMDTHEDNAVMQHVLEKNGFVRCGTVYIENGDPRIAYQRRVKQTDGTSAGKEN